MFPRLSERLFNRLARDILPPAPPAGPLPLGFDALPEVRAARFGERHPETVFYVIWRADQASGFFSNLAFVLWHLLQADSAALQPVVDFQSFLTLYNEAGPVSGTRNAWEYYFLPTAPVPLAEVYESGCVVFCDGRAPHGPVPYVTRMPRAREALDRHVRVRPEIEEEVRSLTDLLGTKTLGVHVRGQGGNRTRGHPFGPTGPQVAGVVRRVLAEHDFDRILVISDDEGSLESLRTQFGSAVVTTPSFRTRGRSAYCMDPRPRHRYLLGREVLRDTLLLSRCEGLVASLSHVSEFATLLHDGSREVDLRIWNGCNGHNRLLALYAWDVRRRLPARLGGLPGDVYDVAHCPHPAGPA